MSTRGGLIKKLLLCVLLALMLSVVFTACELKDPVTDSIYYINDSEANYYNKDHTTSEEAVNEFTDSITDLRAYLDSESFVDSGYYMGVDFDIDILDAEDRTAGNFALKIQSFLYTYPYEDEEGNPIYKYYENGQYYDTNNEAGTRTLVSALEIHNEAIKKSDISIEWYNGATNEVLIGLYFDGLNSDSDNPGNILYVNIQGYKRSFADFGDTVLYQQLIRLLTSLSVESLLESLGLQADAGTGSINSTMTALIGDNYKRVVNNELISLLFYSVTLDAVAPNVTQMLYDLLGVFGRKWDPMTYKFLGFKFSTVANAIIETMNADMQAIISPDKQKVNNVLTNAFFAFDGVVNSYDVLYTYSSNIHFDYGWTYPETLKLDTEYYKLFDYGNYEFQGTLYVPAWDAQFDALIRTDIQQYDNSTNNVFIEFRDIANGELMIGVYYRNERAYLDISGMEYMYGWIDVKSLGFPQVYDEHIDLARELGKFFRTINNTIVAIVDSILDPATSDKENSVLDYIMKKTSFTEKIDTDLFSINSETLQVDIELVKQMLEETGAGTYSTRQIINILDSLMPYTMDQIAIMLGISSAEVMLEKTYFTLTWNVDTNEMTMIMYTNVGIEPGEPSNMIFQLELTPTYFGEYVKISEIDFSGFKPLGQIYTYSGTLKGDFVFSSQETVDLSKLLSSTIGESSGLNTPYVLATNAGLTFTLIYDQFVTDCKVNNDGKIVDEDDPTGTWRLAGRSAFDLTVWLTGSETADGSATIIIKLCSDDVSFNNEVYKDLPAREAELGYVWVSIECVTRNGVQYIPKVKIREDVFMASMSAYMNNETSIGDDVNSFADNDFNLSLTSIITALCKDAYVVAEPEQMEITSSNETLQNLFRVSGLIGNIKVDAGFTHRVNGLASIKDQYYMYQVGQFENIEGNSPYDTALHSTLTTFFYKDFMEQYAPLEYDFYVYRNSVLLDDGTLIEKGTMMLFNLGAEKTVTRQPIEYSSSSFFNGEDANNQDISQVRFLLSDLPFVYYSEERETYYYYTYYNKNKDIADEYVYTAADGTVYILWLGITDVLFHDSDAQYYYYDMDMALCDDKGNYVYLFTETSRDLLFEYDPESVKVKSTCKTQYAPRTNGSFMGEVRRYFVVFYSVYQAELGAVNGLYYNPLSQYPQYYNDADKNYVEEIYDDEGILISRTPKPIQLYVMEPCEELATTVTVVVNTTATTPEVYTFNAQFLIDWEQVTTKGYMVVTDVLVAPGMMGQVSFPVRIIVTNREIEVDEVANNIFTSTSDDYSSSVPVVDEIDVDPYDYILAKYKYLSDPANFNPAVCFTEAAITAAYNEAVRKFAYQYFAQTKFAFSIDFAWEDSYLYAEGVESMYIAKNYRNYSVNEDGTENFTAYSWNFDAYEFGQNVENSISPDGGYIYLHTYFYGQLIALRVNIGTRNFDYIKFDESDNFNVNEYNKNNSSDTYIYGLYQGNYYDKDSYKIGRQPIFVFSDKLGNEYEYVFDMKLITGLAKNSNGKYSATYLYNESYELSWGEPEITNVNTTGSYFLEYTYTYLYKDEWLSGTMAYSALTGAQKAQKVRYIDANGQVVEGPLYTNEAGYASTRKRITYTEFTALLTDKGLLAELDSYETVNYGTGRAYKFVKEGDGVQVRSEEKTLVNRPFYYFEDANGNLVYLTEEEYLDYINNGSTEYTFVTTSSSQITTTALDLYYLLRIYFAIDNNLMSISVVNNSIVKKEVIGASGTMNYDVIVVRIVVECPQLDVAVNSVQEHDELTDEYYYPDTVDAGDKKALGYYKVDPLNSETFTLPQEMTIYFTDDSGRLSQHKFSQLVWAASFDDEDNPVYTYTVDGVAHDLISVEEDGSYKLAIDIQNINGTLKFKVMTKIGNEISGYQYVTVCISVLSKEPTDIQFFATGSDAALVTQKTTVQLNTGEIGNTRMTYYTYYANTFADFKLPSRIIATFSDGHKQNYVVNWRMIGKTGDLVFAPDTLVNLVTTIGTDEGVEIDIYLCVVVENYSVDQIIVSNSYTNYYVTVQNTLGAIAPDKARIGDLLHYDKDKIGYYVSGQQTYYPRISMESAVDDDVPANDIGLYSLDENTGKYKLSATVSVYDFITMLYSKARINLTKSEFDYGKQQIISANSSVLDYNIDVLVSNGSTSTKKVKEMASVSYLRDISTESDVIAVVLYCVDSVNDMKFYPKVTDGKVMIRDLVGNSRLMEYSELLMYLVSENLATQYINWNIVSVDGEQIGNGRTALREYVNYGTQSGLIYDTALHLTETSVVTLKNATNETVTFNYAELTYRLNYYYKNVYVSEGTTATIREKNIEVTDLYTKMDVSEMVYRAGYTNPTTYSVSLGTAKGSYDLKAQLVFAGGLYLNSDSSVASNVNILAYTTLGESQYAGGYILGNNIIINATAVKNDGTNAPVEYKYNITATDEKLVTWYVTESTIDDIAVGSLITEIPASVIYRTGNGSGGRIEMSALTSEGYRFKRVFIIESLPEVINSDYNGIKTNGFTINDGVIKIENIYDYVNPSVETYLATADYLPNSVSISVNGRRITVNDVKWEISPAWYGGVDSRLDDLTYRGTYGSGATQKYLMATAKILGYSEYMTATGEYVNYGQLELQLKIAIDTAEVILLPWESGDIGLSTETIYENGSVLYMVYVDSYMNGKSTAVTAEDTLTLPTTIAARYTSGLTFNFENVTYTYNNVYQVSKIFFDEEGINTQAMTSRNGDLMGVSADKLNKRYIDLKVDLGLSQKLTVRFYFYDKTCTDVSALIEMNDQDIRAAIFNGQRNALNDYINELYESVNYNRVRYNLELLIAEAQSIKSNSSAALYAATAALPLSGELSTLNDIKNALKGWLSGLEDKGTDLTALPITYAYNDTQCYDYARTCIVAAVDALADIYAKEIQSIAKGSGSNTNKANNVKKRTDAFLTAVTEQAYNEIISSYLQKEFSRLFTNVIDGMSDEEYNYTVYYKNMAEVGFDVDKVVKNIYKLRSLYNNDVTDISLVLAQIDVTKSKEAGYPLLTYEDIAVAVVVEELYNAFVYADGLVNVNNENMQVISTVIKEIVGKRFNLEVFRTGAASSAAGISTYTLTRFIEDYAFNVAKKPDGTNVVTKKLMRAYLVNMISEAMDFTFLQGINSECTNIWNEFVGLTDEVINYSFTSISNYDTTIRSMRRSLVSNASIASIVQNFMLSGIKNFIETVYIENIYGVSIKRIQKLNSIVVENDRYTADSYNIAEFTAIMDEASANYVIEPYYAYNSVPKKIVVFFDDGDATKGNVGGFAYRTTINWSVDEITDNMSYLGLSGILSGNIVSEVTGRVAAIEMFVTVKEHVLSENTSGITATLINEAEQLMNRTDDITHIRTANGLYFIVRNGLQADIYQYKSSLAQTAEGYAGESKLFSIKYALNESDRYKMVSINKIEITTTLIEEAMAMMNYDGGIGKHSERTSDGQYFMVRNNLNVFVYKYDSTLEQTPSGYANESRIYTMTVVNYSVYGYLLTSMSGYDSNGDIMYTFNNKRNDDGSIIKQEIYVYNPFEFKQDKNLPSQIAVDGELMNVVWNNVSIQPTGNITSDVSGENQKVTGKIVNENGQSVSMYIYVAQWNYAGLYQTTNASSGITYTVGGEIMNFTYLNPLNFYFSAYSDYAARDYYLMYFKVKILLEDNAGNMVENEIVFKRDSQNISYVEKGEGFTKKIFYPEDSRMLEYGTDDSTMITVNNRSRYIVYWEETAKNRVVNNALATLENCSIYLGNAEIGSYALSRLRAADDTRTPINANYNYEEMHVEKTKLINGVGVMTEKDDNIVTITCPGRGIIVMLDVNSGKFDCSCGRTQQNATLAGDIYTIKCGDSNCAGSYNNIKYNRVTGETVCECETCRLYAQIKDSLLAQSGQVSVVMSVNGYYPTTGVIKLFENNISYAKDNIQVRLLWNGKYRNVINKLKSFIAYAYNDVEESARESYAVSLLMGWDSYDKSQQDEIITLAKAYMNSLNSYTGSYTAAQCALDAYELLATNERYNFAGDVEKLKGGANNSVRATVLIKVGDNMTIYEQSINVKVVFADYSPVAYYRMDAGNLSSLANSIKADNYAGYTSMYIAVRKEYWDSVNNRPQYVTEGKTAPYDEINDVYYKLLQINANMTKTDLSGRKIGIVNISGNIYSLVEVTNIVWEYIEATNMIVSKSFAINGTVYTSNLLQITLN